METAVEGRPHPYVFTVPPVRQYRRRFPVRLPGGVSDAVLLGKGLAIGALSHVQNHLGGIGKGGLIDTGGTLGDIDALQREAVAQRIGGDVRHGLRQVHTSDLGVVEERQHTDGGRLAALLELHGRGVLAVCKGVVAHAGDVLADDDLLDGVADAAPGLLGMGGVVGHGSAAADPQLTVGVQGPHRVLAAAAAGPCWSAFCFRLRNSIVPLVNYPVVKKEG